LRNVAPWLLAVPMMGLGFLLMVGIGMVREGGPILITALAAMAVLLPAAGAVAPLREHRVLALPIAVIVWNAGLVVSFPLYFPGERDDALAAGLGVMGAPLGWTPDPAIANGLAALLPGIEGRPASPPVARAAPPVTPPPAVVAAPAVVTVQPGLGVPDSVVLPYEGQGTTLTIPVELEGRNSQVIERSFIFDTGATLTTLDRSTLRRLGVRVPSDAPEISFQTANGERTSQLVMIDRLWLGGLQADGVTVGVCDECANDGVVGLLGLNVSRRFLVTVDQARQELILQPRAGEVDASADIKYWAELSSAATRWPDGRMEVELEVLNRARRDIARVDVEIQCGEAFTARVLALPAGESRTQTVSLPVGTECDGYTVGVAGAAWASATD
jgi:clan AA aspartic protease (TIGR02281 family)